MSRFVLGVEYHGGSYLGWQRQRQSPTVQQLLEAAVSAVAGQACQVHAAGRTDTGVHARCQIAHFDSTASRTQRQWLLGINSNLPATVCVLWVQAVSTDFHARFSALARSYEYLICNRPVRPALLHGLQTWIRQPLQEKRMHQAAGLLLGEHDFSSFRAQGCQAKSPSRTILDIHVSRSADTIRLYIKANAFLYHMVRNIMGSLIEVGLGEKDPDWITGLLQARDRNLVGMTAPAAGLYFLHAEYAWEFALPTGGW